MRRENRRGSAGGRLFRGAGIATLWLVLCLTMLPHAALTASAGGARPDYTVEAVTPYTVYTTTRLNVRTGPGVGWDWIETLEEGTAVTVTGVASTDWLQVKTADLAECYLSYRYVTKTKGSTVPDWNKEETKDETAAEKPAADEEAETKAPDAAAEETAAEKPAAAAEETEAAGETMATEETEAASEGSAVGEPAETTAEPVGEESETTVAAAEETAVTDETMAAEETEAAPEGSAASAAPATTRTTTTTAADDHEHVAGAWVVTKEATWTKAGVRIQYCTICDQALYVEEVPANTLPLILLIGGIAAGVVLLIVVLLVRAGRK